MADGRTMWDGVRNYEARNNLRAMKKGDLLLYYHSNEGKEMVGIAKVARTAYQDPTTDEDWSVVDVEPVKPLKKTVTLAQVKAHPLLSKMNLVKRSRISVVPVDGRGIQHGARARGNEGQAPGVRSRTQKNLRKGWKTRRRENAKSGERPGPVEHRSRRSSHARSRAVRYVGIFAIAPFFSVLGTTSSGPSSYAIRPLRRRARLSKVGIVALYGLLLAAFFSVRLLPRSASAPPRVAGIHLARRPLLPRRLARRDECLATRGTSFVAR